MILPDINLLIHAHNLESHADGGREPQPAARATSESARIVGILRSHRTPGRCSRIQDWLTLPQVHIPLPAADHFARLTAHLEHLGTAGNLTTDAHLRPSPWNEATSCTPRIPTSPASRDSSGSTRWSIRLPNPRPPTGANDSQLSQPPKRSGVPGEGTPEKLCQLIHPRAATPQGMVWSAGRKPYSGSHFWCLYRW